MLILWNLNENTKFHVLAENIQENMVKQDAGCYSFIYVPHPIVSIFVY